MKKKTILVVDDDLEVCDFYKVLLEPEGYVIQEAHTRHEAFIQLGSEPPNNKKSAPVPTIPDLIILDIMLPKIEGYALFSHLLQYDTLRKIPVIIITTKSRMSDLFASSPNIKHFFSKPFDSKLLKEKIKEIIG